MAHNRVCPWWMGYLLANPLRRLMQDPARMLAPYIRPGMTVLEPGPGMGFFTLELARRVGPQGRVVAVDLQPKMIEALRRRAARAGLLERVETRVVGRDSMELDDLSGRADFALAFAMVHEMPDAGRFFEETARALKPGGRLLLAEPAGHVSASDFDAEIAAAARSGLRELDRPEIRRSRTALLGKA